jgi:hypothetical protein
MSSAAYTTLGTLKRVLRVLGTSHPRWREGFTVRKGPLGIQRGYRVTAVDASGAEFGFGVYAGTDETAEQMAEELMTLLRSVQEYERA